MVTSKHKLALQSLKQTDLPSPFATKYSISNLKSLALIMFHKLNQQISETSNLLHCTSLPCKQVFIQNFAFQTTLLNIFR